MIILKNIAIGSAKLPKLGSSTLFIDLDNRVAVKDINGGVYYAAGGIPKNQVVEAAATSGFTSNWLLASPFSERFSVTLNSSTESGDANVVLEGTNNSSDVSGEVLGTWIIPNENIGVEDISSPIATNFHYIRFNVTIAGSGNVTLKRGV